MPEFRCPVCRARLDQGPECRRCKADLSLLFALEEQRNQALAQGYAFGKRRQWQAAQAIGEGVDAIRSDDTSLCFLAICFLMNRNFPRALSLVSTKLRKFPGNLKDNQGMDPSRINSAID